MVRWNSIAALNEVTLCSKHYKKKKTFMLSPEQIDMLNSPPINVVN